MMGVEIKIKFFSETVGDLLIKYIDNINTYIFNTHKLYVYI